MDKTLLLTGASQTTRKRRRRRPERGRSHPCASVCRGLNVPIASLSCVSSIVEVLVSGEFVMPDVKMVKVMSIVVVHCPRVAPCLILEAWALSWQ